MKCRNPYLLNGMAFGCGQCMPCRVAKRRVWTHRIMLETAMHSDNTFVTLTYSDENMPRLEDGRGILVPKHMQDWLKRLRRAYSDATQGRKLRFYGVGEYGDNSWRPHFHLALFNFPNCRYGQSRYFSGVQNCCFACDMVRDTWSFGNVMLAELNVNTSQYVCGYVTKKMTAKDDVRLKGLPPEFARMSLRPGIGADAMHDVASTLLQFDLVEGDADVPSALRHGKRLLPLGNYLTRKLRTYVGKDEKAPESVLQSVKKELQPLRDAAFENSRSLKKEIVQAADQAVLNMEARQEIFRQRKDKL